MPSKTRSYREALLEALANPVEAAHYLNAAFDDSPEMFLKALKNVAQANQMSKVAKDAGVARENLYRALSEEGNPTLGTLHSVLTAVGLKIEVSPLKTPEPICSLRPRGGNVFNFIALKDNMPSPMWGDLGTEAGIVSNPKLYVMCTSYLNTPYQQPNVSPEKLILVESPVLGVFNEHVFGINAKQADSNHTDLSSSMHPGRTFVPEVVPHTC
jgi:probable addiction module antidote protein